jgi:hypothetical protein
MFYYERNNFCRVFFLISGNISRLPSMALFPPGDYFVLKFQELISRSQDVFILPLHASVHTIQKPKYFCQIFLFGAPKFTAKIFTEITVFFRFRKWHFFFKFIHTSQRPSP